MKEKNERFSSGQSGSGILETKIPCLYYTFASRLKFFVSDVQTNCQMGNEEKEYIQKVANDLLEYQKQNAIEQWEKDYLQRCHGISTTGQPRP